MSIRALSKALRWDYKNVHTDVRELERAGLVASTADGQVMVPWDTVLAEVRLEAA
jgi:predicted transcriptional regulator